MRYFSADYYCSVTNMPKHESFNDRLEQLRLSHRTKQQYNRIVRQFGRKDPLRWLKEQIDNSTPIGTVLPLRSAIKHYLIAEQGLEEDEAEQLLPKARGRSNQMRAALTPTQLEVYKEEASNVPDPCSTILLLLPETGMRISELCDLRVTDDTVFQGIRGFLFRGKGDKQRFIPLSTRATELLDSYKERLQPVEWMFTGYQDCPIRPAAVRKHTRKMGQIHEELTGVSPHLLRHTFATNALRGGMELRNLQVLLGHASIETTARYLHPDAQMLFDAIKSLEASS